MIGTLSSVDSTSGAGRVLYKAGYVGLGVSSLPFTGTGGTTYEYRTVGGGYGQSLTLTAYTSGSATVTIVGTFPSSIAFTNGSVSTDEGVAVRQGRGFSATTGNQSVTSGQYESLLLTNPTSSTMRLMLVARQAYCDNPTGTTAPKWYSLSDPTTNLPATAASAVNRKTGGGASVATVAYTASATTYPDTATSTPLASRVAGTVPTGGLIGGPGEIMRTVEPGHSYSLTILGVANGLGTTPVCGMNFAWFEEPLQ